MSTIRKISLEYRLARADKREKKATKAREEQMALFHAALKSGMIKPPKPMVDHTSRMQLPRESLMERLKIRHRFLTLFDVIAWYKALGHRVGLNKPVEVHIYPHEKTGKYLPHFGAKQKSKLHAR